MFVTLLSTLNASFSLLYYEYYGAPEKRGLEMGVSTRESARAHRAPQDDALLRRLSLLLFFALFCTADDFSFYLSVFLYLSVCLFFCFVDYVL